MKFAITHATKINRSQINSLKDLQVRRGIVAQISNIDIRYNPKTVSQMKSSSQMTLRHYVLHMISASKTLGNTCLFNKPVDNNAQHR